MTGTETTKIFQDRLNDLFSEAKENSGITLRDIENDTGVSRSILSKYQNDGAEIGINNLVKLSKYFNVSIDYLSGISEHKTFENSNIGEEIGLSDNAIEWLREQNSFPDNYLGAINTLFELGSLQWFCSAINSLRRRCIVRKYEDILKTNDTKKIDEDLKTEINIFLSQQNISAASSDEMFDLSKYKLIKEFEKLIDEIIATTSIPKSITIPQVSPDATKKYIINKMKQHEGCD